MFNFYLVSGPDYSANSELISSLLTVDNSVPTFVGGDFNFVEAVSDSTSVSPSLPTAEFASVWDAFRTHFSLDEVSHGAHTYFHVTKDALSPYSHTARLDRFLIPSDAVSHPLFSPSVGIPHHHTNFSVAHISGPRRSFSDHLPVRISFDSGPTPGFGRSTIPTWLAESPAFATAFRDLWVPSAGHPFRTLTRFKATLFRAAKVARRVKVESSTVNLMVSQRVALFKLITCPLQDLDRISALLRMAPSLTSLISLRGTRWVSNGLEEAARDSITSAATTSSQDKSPNILRSLADKLPCSRAQIASLRLAPDDPPAVTPKDRSTLASSFWSKVWDKRPSVPFSQRDEFLQDYDKEIDQSLCPQPDLAFLSEVIRHSNNSSPGPDGIPFAAWRAVIELASPVLLRVFEAIVKGHLPSVGFNHGILFLLPKKDTV